MPPMTHDPCTTPLLDHPEPATGSWYVLWTHSHSEQLVHDQLAIRGLDVFLPTIETWRRVRGMRQRCTVPMFAGYLFLNHRMDRESYVAVCNTRGLVKLLGDGWNRLATVPERDVEAVRKLHTSRLPATPHPYLQVGQRVRVNGGLLADVEGILLRTVPNKGLLVVSVDILQRSVAVQIDSTLVVPA